MSHHYALLRDDLLADANVGPAAKLMYASLLTFRNCREIHPGVEEIARRCGLSVRTVRRAMTELEGAGWISLDRVQGGRGLGNAYQLLLEKPGHSGRVSGDGNPANFAGNAANFVAKPGQKCDGINRNNKITNKTRRNPCARYAGAGVDEEAWLEICRYAGHRTDSLPGLLKRQKCALEGLGGCPVVAAALTGDAVRRDPPGVGRLRRDFLASCRAHYPRYGDELGSVAFEADVPAGTATDAHSRAVAAGKAGGWRVSESA